MKRHFTFLVCLLFFSVIPTASAGIVTDFDALVPPGTDPNFFDIDFGGTSQLFSFTSTLAIEIGGTDEALFDQFRNIDTMTVDQATLVLNIVSPSDAVGAAVGAAPHFCPAPGDSFQIIDAQTILVTRPFRLQLDPRLESQLGLSWDTSALYTTGTISVVPEPSPMLLLFSLTFALAFRQWIGRVSHVFKSSQR